MNPDPRTFRQMAGTLGLTLALSSAEPTPPTRDALAFCRDCQARHMLTVDFCRVIAAADLVVERCADVTLDDGQRLGPTGRRVIDEARFNRLPAESSLASFLALRP